MFNFEYPYLAILIIIPPIIRLLTTSFKKEEEVTEILHPNIKNLQNAFGSSRIGNTNINFKDIITYIIYCLLVLAIMKPQFTNKKVTITNKGRDIIIAADLSGSMRALDFSTKIQYISRLDIAKATTSAFIKERVGDRIGLILFGNNAYLHVPLTLDLQSVTNMLNNTVIGMAGESTAIGDAIGLAVQKLRKSSKKEVSTIILLTDGENTSGQVDPITAARIAKEYGIKIYVIGIGKSGIAPIADERGKIFQVEVKLDEKTLKEIAKITDGKYFNVTNKNLMQEVYHQINRLEATDNEEKEFLIKKQLYPIPLGIAITMLLIIAILPLINNIRTTNLIF